MTDHERTEVEAALATAQYASILWKLPLIGNADVPVALGMAQSTWQLLKVEPGVPQAFYIGTRPFYRTADLLKWIESLEPKENPGNAGVEEVA